MKKVLRKRLSNHSQGRAPINRETRSVKLYQDPILSKSNSQTNGMGGRKYSRDSSTPPFSGLNRDLEVVQSPVEEKQSQSRNVDKPREVTLSENYPN